MKIMFKTFLLLCLLGFSYVAVEAKDWRGIVPLKSTRSDVTRILDESPDANNIRANYDLDEGHIYIVFASEDAYYDCVKKLPVNTVLLIQFRPKRGLSLSDLKFDVSKFKKFDVFGLEDINSEDNLDNKDLDFAGYINDEEGVVIRASRNEVDEVNYIAASKDRKLCPAYYENPKSFVQIACILPAQ